MKKIDKEHIEHPAKGVVGMTDFLLEHNFKVGLRRVQRLMRLMGIQAVYRKRSLSTLGTAKYIKPYLLIGLKARARRYDRPYNRNPISPDCSSFAFLTFSAVALI